MLQNLKKMELKKNEINICLFSLCISLLTYGYGLMNFSLPIDAQEEVINPNFMLSVGRWGICLIRYHLFHGYTPYFTPLVSLVLLCLSSLMLIKLLNIQGIYAYAFCILYLTFPQLAYQLVFITQADAIALGYVLSIISIWLFIKSIEISNKRKAVIYFLFACFIAMFTLSIYQAFIFVILVVYLSYLLFKDSRKKLSYKYEISKSIVFILFIVVSALFYVISLKLVGIKGYDDYIESSYTSHNSLKNTIFNFINLLKIQLLGKAYFGNSLYIIATLLFILSIFKYFLEKKIFQLRTIILSAILILPFFISLFITGGYHPPRLYLATNISFSIIIIDFFLKIKKQNMTIVLVSFVGAINVLFITQLYYSQKRVRDFEVIEANKMDLIIRTKYPEFKENINPVYFHGGLEKANRFKLNNSEVFGGSFLQWNGGNNGLILGFFRYYNIANYKMIEKDDFIKIKDSINNMPIWPDYGSVKMVEGVVIIKLGEEYGYLHF
ncbi:hypothetical protein C4S76_10405 [Apibacter adventoris]|nr:hypothetical protein C4S76_10405 [Apibacter adventoris]